PLPAFPPRRSADLPEAEESHDVVDAQGAGVAEEGAQEVAEGGVAGGGEAVGAPGRQAPVLAAGVEGVGGCAGGHAGGEVVLLGPGVGSAGVHANGEVVDDADGHARVAGGALGGGELFVGEPGEPGVEVDAVRELAAGAVGPG